MRPYLNVFGLLFRLSDSFDDCRIKLKTLQLSSLWYTMWVLYLNLALICLLVVIHALWCHFVHKAFRYVRIPEYFSFNRSSYWFITEKLFKKRACFLKNLMTYHCACDFFAPNSWFSTTLYQLVPTCTANAYTLTCLSLLYFSEQRLTENILGKYIKIHPAIRCR